ncbi:Uncharacterized protein BM_BM9262 [Brugia malayi]|uniref:Bm9262 n=1 Tax=Brugia malayi TaxID=6279 RepID=A0A0H5S475_BRUMA|nr:Uncharacterized protein BM_BM9262 [Brugia malayi]CRZ23516.1 Bm9262 [Brugia malayi]VIO92628.1 Uncharacterized protein BM_BM9262 [Brugia malayi]
MLRQRSLEHKAVHCNLQSNRFAHSSASVFVDKPVQRLQELDVKKREPILLRCSAIQRTHFVQINTLQRTSEIYTVLHEFHTAVTQSMFRLVPSLETDECPVRYIFASLSGRSTYVQLRSSPIYTIHWHVISPSKEVQIRHRTVVRLSHESILQPMKMQTAERWHMNWEYVVYRISHGLHFAIMKNVADMSPQQRIVYVRAQKAYPRRFIRCSIAPIQKKKILKASEAYPIKMCTVDRGEPFHVKKINIPKYRECMDTNYNAPLQQISECSFNSAIIKCSCCYDTMQ